MGARRSPATEALLDELLGALRGCDPEVGMTCDELGQACPAECHGWVHDPERRRREKRPPRHADCWCKGTRLRPRHGSEVRRYVIMLCRDGLARCELGVRGAPWPECLQHFYPTVEADVAAYWDHLAEQADHHVAS